MTNRIGGDYSHEALEAFRAAYAQQLSTPQDQDIDARTGLPTSHISNTSPWIDHVGIWKYPSGKGPDDDLKQPFQPESYYEEEETEEDSEEEGQLTEEEVDALIDEILQELDERESEDESSTQSYE
jgi:hypothetical protein